MLFGTKRLSLPTANEALKGRAERMRVPERHLVLGTPLEGPFPPHLEQAVFGMGCFWGPERRFWQVPGVYTTAVGYAGGYTPNPAYEEVCSGLTGHAEVVLVVFDPAVVTYRDLLRIFWENHDPTQGMRQGNDIGTQYRSVIFHHTPAQREIAMRLIEQLGEAKLWSRPIVTQVEPAGVFWMAEDYHQEYYRRNPGQGYCMFVVEPKVQKFRKAFMEKLKNA